jgi:hypothetical protein
MDSIFHLFYCHYLTAMFHMNKMMMYIGRTQIPGNLWYFENISKIELERETTEVTQDKVRRRILQLQDDIQVHENRLVGKNVILDGGRSLIHKARSSGNVTTLQRSYLFILRKVGYKSQ